MNCNVIETIIFILGSRLDIILFLINLLIVDTYKMTEKSKQTDTHNKQTNPYHCPKSMSLNRLFCLPNTPKSKYFHKQSTLTMVDSWTGKMT